MARVNYNFKVFKNYLTDIQSAKLTKMDTLGKFYELYEKSDPAVGLIYQTIEKRTIEYGKFFERISFAEFKQHTKLSERKIQYVITSMLKKGMIVRASSKIDDYRHCHAYSFNWLRLSDNPSVKLEFMKEYNRLQQFQIMSALCDEGGAPHAGQSDSTRTTCGLNNNSHTSLRKNNNNHGYAQQADRSRKVEEKMNIDEIHEKTLAFSEEAKLRKAMKSKARAEGKKTIRGEALFDVWSAAMLKHWPDAAVTGWSQKTGWKIAAKLRRDFSDPTGKIDVAAAFDFVEWSIANWGFVALEMGRWWKGKGITSITNSEETRTRGNVSVPKTPDGEFFIAAYNTCMKMRSEDAFNAKKQQLLDMHDPDPMVREKADLEARGLDDGYVADALKRRKRHIEKEDAFSKVRKQSKAMRDAMDYAQRNLYGTYTRAAKNAQKLARETGTLVPVDTVKKPILGVTVDGPDGKQYPIEVMLYFKPAAWNDDPEVMAREMDEAFFDAVAAFDAAKDEFQVEE